MNQMYIAHVEGRGMMSMMIKAITKLNHPNDTTIFTHNALVYRDETGKCWLMEIDITYGMRIVPLATYKSTSGATTLKYTPLVTIPTINSTFTEFQNFFKRNFQNRLLHYSLNKALQSLKINALPNLNIFEEFEKSMKAHGDTDITSNNKFAIANLFTIIADELSKIGKSEDAKLMTDLATAINQSMTVDYANNIAVKYSHEKYVGTDSGQFFYCTELLIKFVRGWCAYKKVSLPAVLEYYKIDNQVPAEIYPHELFTLVKEQSEFHILESIECAVA